MNSVDAVMSKLEKLGSEQTRKTYTRHGAPAGIFGVKVGDLKKVAQQIKGNQALASQLYETGNGDAQYLAGLVADGSEMTKRQLDSWCKTASWHMVSDSTLPWVAAESRHGRDLAVKWIASRKESVACTGWCTFSLLVAVKPDDELDLDEIKELLERIAGQIHDAPNRVRYAMNGFVISVGTYVKPLLKQAKRIAKRIGAVPVDMGDTACKVPLATEYIEKVEAMGRIGRKRKTVRC